MANMPGAFTETRDATEETQKICHEVKCQVEEMTKKTYEVFTAFQFRTQVVAGAIFLIKVHVGGDNYHVLKVSQSLNRELSVLDVLENKGKDDPIVPF